VDNSYKDLPVISNKSYNEIEPPMLVIKEDNISPLSKT